MGARLYNVIGIKISILFLFCFSGKFEGKFLSQGKECNSSTYGEDCNKSCSDHCAGDTNSCNHVNGTCDEGCDIGYLMPLCTEKCNSSTYGEDCNKNCSDHCAGDTNSCNHVNGTCDQGCDSGYVMPLCTESKSARQELLIITVLSYH
ncbi:multiple epidermal growth factor-like domains 10 [Plakobranchus ocellatus]|uniref:Multiple epidermal growth factor-like domains 10 n=1 Tax=Plakobranchus ocellatus TaxID=259542 RepID=A0AAV4C4Q0_9GAST|nr:multiple epidermal growth factor-like domains 10 [Plakobranchus ocellatus]